MTDRSSFNLLRSPFSPEIEHHALFASDGYRQCHARLDFLRRERGLAAVVGDFGSGKTSCLRGFLGQLAPSSHHVLYAAVSIGGASIRPVVEGWLEELGERIPFNTLAASLRLLQRALAAIYEKGRLPFIVLDEAHLLDHRGLLQLKPLLNHDMDSRLPPALVLSGGPGLARQLAFHGLQEVRQRLLFVYPFHGLARDELQPYVEARVRHAGGDRALFSPEVIDELYRHTQGLPRLVNPLANLCLLSAATAGKHQVDSMCVRQALVEMGLADEGRRDPMPVAGLRA